MSSNWRAAGLTYLKYAEACAQALRISLKEELQASAMRRSENVLKVAKWDAGKQLESKFVASLDKTAPKSA